ncbi:MAG: phosphohistidine phosphatase SixA [Candidatus Omnitrophica bacterium CG11_big_fil_rev_8_21_14_0_20_64_10]|nr:MAG: phosphohistidine phosphatase SixA [Candidatus Omnitrophica bacterium CG11_big_fil_rev_8_21_14_0_20_64_10]
MKLTIMRHAIAAPRGMPGQGRDADRPLTEEGIEQAREVARGLERLKLDFDLILTSPYRRAAQTAELAAHELDIELEVRPWEALEPQVSPAETSKGLKKFAGKERLLLVGHEPHLSGWIAELTASPGGVDCVMKKGGVACVTIDQVPPQTGSGSLRWLMTPKQLALIGKSGGKKKAALADDPGDH